MFNTILIIDNRLKGKLVVSTIDRGNIRSVTHAYVNLIF